MLAALVMIALTQVSQAPAPPPRYAVMRTEVGGGLDPAVGPQVAAKLAEALRERTGGEVISSDEMISMLQHEKERAILGSCKEGDSCLAELANALGADAIVAPRLSKVEGALILSVSVVDAHTASVRARVTETWGGESLLLLSLARPVVDKLLAGEPPPVGVLDVVGAPPGARLILDGSVRGTAPAGQMGGVVVGAHRLEVQADGMKPLLRWIIVERDQVLSVAVALEVDEAPFYTTWWFWTGTGAGVVATAAAVTGVVLFLGGGQTGVAVQLNADQVFAGAQ
ncbi:MAG: PEGA domain-containing protein [Deltaproteobacteria bacterium]|nr:PEGA domain-containing protein [Deltaproteobacteria bacterium]